MNKKYTKITFILFALVLASSLFAQVIERFPKPDFQSGYTRPEMQIPLPRSEAMQYVDVAVLVLALSLASYFALKKRSRKHIFVLMIFSLAYFGFYREGCICPVGSTQNITAALFDSGYVIPLTAVAFFMLPLVFTLFFGRTFCAAVCPLGAIQDAVTLKPVQVPRWLSEVLGIIPYIYLGLAVLFAATGAGFLICRYDPFVGFFRLGASFNMVVFGLSLLILGTVVARPYCRYLCPYGVLLNWMSRLSRRHVVITPTDCINCRLCEASCPFGAINKPTEAKYQESRESSVRRIATLMILAPVIVLASGWVFSQLHISLASQHPTVLMAEEIRLEDSGRRTETTVETRAFRGSGQPTADLFNEAILIQNKFRLGCWLLGGFLGLIFCVKFFNLSILRKEPDYVADNGTCFSCARCFSYCPMEQVRLGLITPEQAEELRGKPETNLLKES